MKKIFTVLCLAISIISFAQVKIGAPGAPHPRAVLDLDGDPTRGLLMPRLTEDQRTALTNVPQGLMVYQTNGTAGIWYCRGTLFGTAIWEHASEGNNYWRATGADQSHIYTTASGNTGIGTGASSNPVMKLHVEDADSNLAVFSNTAVLASNTKAGIYLMNKKFFGGNFYTAAIKSTGISAADARLGLFTGVSADPNALTEKLTVLGNGDVGIGTTVPGAKLDILTSLGDDGLRIGTSSQKFVVRPELIGTAIGMASNNPLHFITNNSLNLTISPTGLIGIGNIIPKLGGLVVDKKVGAVNAIFGSNTTGVAIESNFPGIGFNSYFNNGHKSIQPGFNSLAGQDPGSGRFYISTSAAAASESEQDISLTERFTIKPNGNIGVQGNTDPQSPLSFANTTGEKLNFYDVSASANYGIGIQGAQMQMYTGSSTDAISFGYGSSASFTEKVRMQNNFMILNNGRIRFNGQYSAGNSSGIEFTKTGNNSATQGFIGMIDDNNLGFYGFGGAGWGFLYDVNDGAVKIGTTQKATGYKLNVGGKIIAEEVRVQLRSAWPDYVFSKNYNLRSLKEVEKYITVNNHLPNVPAAADVQKSGIALGEMQTKMMEKIEELTLYVIELEKKIEASKKK